MFPVLSTGDSVIVSSIGDLTAGDIILYRNRGNLICHRIVKIINKDGKVFYITRGDSLLYDDGSVSLDDIIGKVSAIERSRVSLLRRMLLLIHPFLRAYRLNAILMGLLLRIKQLTRSLP